jgi:hypothetical protein
MGNESRSRIAGAQRGAEVHDMRAAVIRYRFERGPVDKDGVTLVKDPEWEWVRREILRSEDVVLLLGFWRRQGNTWRRVGRRYVTAAGMDETDAAEPLQQRERNRVAGDHLLHGQVKRPLEPP